MGLLVDGKWQDTWYDTGASGGHFERQAAKLRFPASETGGYHTYTLRLR